MKSLWRENQADIIEAFNSISRYLDDLVNIDNIYFDQMVDRKYPTELQLNKVNSSIPRHLFWIWNFLYLMVQFPLNFMTNGTILILIYSNSLIPRRTSYGVYQPIWFAWGSSNLSDCSCRALWYSVFLKNINLQQGISEPEFYGDLVYRIRKIVVKSNFSEQFRKLINRIRE